MAAQTKTVIVNNTGWTLLAPGNCLATTRSLGVSIRYGSSQPDNSVGVEDGHPLAPVESNYRGGAIGIDNSQGGNCYGRTGADIPTAKVVVTEY